MSRIAKNKGVVSFLLLCLLCIGVVFGDIGTSPLYTEGALFFPSEGEGVPIDTESVVGANSAMLWFLYLIVGCCYCALALRADHNGEGGVLALYAKLKDHPGKLASYLCLLLILGTGLLMGDGIITPPISILGGLEGMEVVTPALKPWIVPATLLILSGLFYFQYKGTATIGLAFGPIMMVWFLSIAGIGIGLIAERPDVLHALNPYYGIKFLLGGGAFQMKVHFMGAAMLAITGGEALYADLGHFSKWSIRVSFMFVVVCLTLNYLGQAAFVMNGGEVLEGNVFYSSIRHLLGPSGVIAMIVVGTKAAIIASQALITGMFSIVALAVALKLITRVETRCTSEDHKGQIYQPRVNMLLYLGCFGVTLWFQSTKALEAAYGLAVAGLMLITCKALAKVFRTDYKWPLWKIVAVFLPIGLIEAAFLAANAVKFMHGGYWPVAIGFAAFIVMTTWKWGTERLSGAISAFGSQRVEWLQALKDNLEDRKLAVNSRFFFANNLVEGNASISELDRSIVFPTSHPVRSLSDRVPVTLQAFVQRYGAVPSRILFFHVFIDPNRARMNGDERFEVFSFGFGIYSVVAHYGYMEAQTVNVRATLNQLGAANKLPAAGAAWGVEIGEEDISADADISLIDRLRLKLFLLMRKYAVPAHHYFGLAGDAGLSKVSIPIRFRRSGVEVTLSELQIVNGVPLFPRELLATPITS